MESPPRDAPTEVLRDVGRFADSIRKALDGDVSPVLRPFSPVTMSSSGTGHTRERSGRSMAWSDLGPGLDMTEALQESYSVLKQAIEATAPKFRPLSSSDSDSHSPGKRSRPEVASSPYDASGNPVRAMTPRAPSPEHGRTHSRSGSLRNREVYSTGDSHSDYRNSNHLDIANGPYDMDIDDVMAAAPRSAPNASPTVIY